MERLDVRHVLLGDVRDRNVVNVDLVALDQIKQQIERPVVHIQIDAIILHDDASVQVTCLAAGHRPALLPSPAFYYCRPRYDNDPLKIMAKTQTPQSESLAFAAGVLRAEAEAVTNVIAHLGQDFDKAVERLAACTGTVIVSGMGKSGIIAQKISATLASTGTPSHYLHPSEAMHGDLGRIRADDLVILLSYSGATDEVLGLAAVIRQDKVPVIALCARPDSHLARISDLALCVGDVTEACPHNLAPTASTTAMLALGDALALAVSQRRHFSVDDFRKRHPGGLLGRQMLPITDVLRFRAGDNLPLIHEDRTVAQVLDEAARYPRRAGAVMLVDDAGRLSGLFTDADLRRLIIEHGTDGMARPIDAVMTRSPRSLTDDQLVRDAVQLMRELRVDEIPVVDAAGKPVGLIDVQDLVALKVIEE
ncbi:MAG: KpsF/GutQ family sugar-phosphate isomerase [Planctomycetes bacterium]|nr:KpsF/GutQ family sugar-phosphate isomerase [Planctomycetota bacterium]